MINKIFLNKKVLIPSIAIILVLEILLFCLFKNDGAKLTMLVGMIIIPAAVVAINIMFSSLEMAILTSLFTIPMLPLAGYVMLRLGIDDYQYIAYIVFYAISMLAMLKNRLLKCISIDNLVIKNKIIRILMVMLVLLNIIFAYNKLLTFMIVSLSFLPFAIYMYIIKTIKVESRKEFLEKVYYTICLSCTIITVPDLILFIINWVNGNKGIRGFGPLAGNYILLYELIVLIICLNKLVKQVSLKNKWSILVVALLISICTQGSRGGYVTFIAVMLALIIFNFKNYKIYLPILLIGTIFLSVNVFSRTEVSQDTNIVDAKELIDDNELALKKNGGSEQYNDLIVKILNSQSGTRQIIWRATIDITNDNPYFGVGLGNLKYFFDDYTTGKKGYSDAHNLLLNISSELGIPFMLLTVLLFLWIIIDESIKYIKMRDKNLKLDRLTLVVLCIAIIMYGSLTGVALQVTVEVYSFTQTFMLMALLTYRDCIEVN